jgi:hypothetical protein
MTLLQDSCEFPEFRWSIDQSLSADFTMEKLECCQIWESTFDGVYPEFIKNSGTKTKEYMIFDHLLQRHFING